MDLSPKRTTTNLVEDKAWAASEHGFDCTETVTLDLTNGNFPLVDGQILSGHPIKLHAASKMYRVAGAAEVADGHLFESVKVNAGSTKVGGSLLWHGAVIQAQVPNGMVNAQRAPFVRYR